MARRPPAPVRYLVLLAAVVVLGCTVCARARPDAPAAAPSPQAAPGDAGVAPDAAPAAQQPETPPRPDYFPATKAPGYLFEGGPR